MGEPLKKAEITQGKLKTTAELPDEIVMRKDRKEKNDACDKIPAEITEYEPNKK